ncbi:hypothetical protein PY254_12415 [Rhodanobacter sp. AS-Z3]|uniref:hypothetical protein n=1 Tax=Rhodanobacter sp. AS-Z3 TaxID=3031330 RepID=UPI00247AAA7A|nr:hypothetical protein [Rhodanobacter sp. AS-Z3]WEN14038.1 hypothetical protein PY254_12415 [Rhodanobacter sp. AS-Z3]
MEVPFQIHKIPQNLSLRNAIHFCNRLWASPFVEKTLIDCSKMQHVEPFSIAYVSTELRRFAESRSGTSLEFQNCDSATYAALMGFFKAAGADYGYKPGEARGNTNYIPLTILNVSDIEREAADSYEPIGNVIEKESAKLAKMLTRVDSGELVDTLTFSLREIMRNVVEHSHSSVLEFCAQYWPTKHKVEMAVVDSGIGIRESLTKNPYLNISSDRDAIHMALMPAVSGKMFKGVRRNNNDVWQNSGFGLYMTNRICRNGGSFFICSGKSGLLLGDGKKLDLDTNFAGTALRMVINTEKLGDLSLSLAQYRREGYEMAKHYDKDRPIEPSVASTMLFRDFDDGEN